MGTQLKQTDEIGEAKLNITCTRQGADKIKQEKQHRESEGHGETKTTSTQKGTENERGLRTRNIDNNPGSRGEHQRHEQIQINPEYFSQNTIQC